MSELEVYLDGTFCGGIEQSSRGNLTFRYDSDYRTSDNATPMSLSMPLAAISHRKRVVLPWLQGLLPDDPDALRALAQRFSVSASSAFALLEHVGTDVAGAVQIVRPGAEASDRTQSRGNVRAVSDDEVATMLDHVVTEYREGTPYYDAVGLFSLAGAQPKVALHKFEDGRWGISEDATPTTHILKPVAGSFRRVDVVEQMTMRAAAHLGNEVAPSELVRIGDWDVFVTERFDRRIIGGRWSRLHQEDFCQALSVSPAKKYQHRDGGPGLADVAGLARSLPREPDRRSFAERFYRAFVFNVVAGCTDAHAKNYSLMLDGPSVRFAPLYDLTSYAAYWDGQARLDSAMNVRGEYRLDRIGAQQLADAGAAFGVRADDAAEIVDHVRSDVLSAFESARTSFENYGPAALAVADDLLNGVRRLPLVTA